VLGRSCSRRQKAQKVATCFADPRKDDIRKLVHVDVDPIRQINYGLLHNGRCIFEKFQLTFIPEKKGDIQSSPVGTVASLEIEVLLHVGSDSFPFRTMVQISEATGLLDLTEQIHLSLVSEFARSIEESIQTNLFVQVRCADQLIYQQTFRVRLSPVNEWKLDELDIWWLPSFVQSGDPSVAKIVDSAQRYLMAIMDDADVGFAGYQYADVDPQVRAVWSAIVFDYALKYINPPPSFQADAQRLRTPGQIISQGRGTCVDLAVLMASCLESIEVYPVIFMLDNHAFAGYWRNEEAYKTYCEGGSGAITTDRSISQASWISGRSDYAERQGLDAAWALAKKQYFGRVSNHKFHSMIDIVSSRSQVTPLPLVNSD